VNTLPRQFKTRSTARRYRVTIVRTTRENERGYVADVVKPVATVWASVLPVSEQLRIQYQSQSVVATHIITVDGRTNVLETDKIKFGTREFEILTIKQVDENDRDKIIVTSEVRPK